MKAKIAVICLACVALLMVFPATGALANDDNETISEFCSDHADLGLTHGGCVAFFTTNNIVPHDASICRDPAIQAFVGADNHGQCVKKLKDLKNQ